MATAVSTTTIIAITKQQLAISKHPNYASSIWKAITVNPRGYFQASTSTID
jgi:hypothetical protein